MQIKKTTLSIVLVAAGFVTVAGPAIAESRYYDPTNTAAGNDAGKTQGYDLFNTIGCPGKQLLDPGCKVETPKPAPVAAPAPAPVPAPKPTVKEQCMASAKPGECYVTLIQQPVYRTEKVKKLVKEASERIEIVPPVYKAVKVHVTSEEIQEVIPAVYETVKEKVMVKPASKRLETVPAVFETVEERVMVKPATSKAIEIPAVYEDVTEKVKVRDAYTTWKPGTFTNVQKIDEKTGEVFCLVEVPAEYQNVTKRVIKTPASIRYEEIPAEYSTVKRTVLKSPETTREVAVPAEYAERDVTKLAKPAQTVTKTVPVDYMREIMTEVTPATQKRVPVAAEYEEVDQKVLVTPAKEYCTRILCDVNATPDRIALVQRALNASGFNAGTSGVLDAQTMNAVSAFQKAKGLSGDGYLTAETMDAMGVSIK